MNPRRLMMTADTVGGVWVYATDLACRLAQCGVQVTLVTLGTPPQAAKLAAAQSLSPGVKLIVTDLALEWLDPEGNDAARAQSELLRIADETSPDLVHLNGFREGAAAWPCPALVVAHSCVWSWWKAAKGEWPSEPRWSIYREAVAAGLKAAETWAAPSAAFRDVIQKLYEPATAGWVIPNGIDAPSPSRTAKEHVILASGRVWDGGKNLIGLAKVAAELPWPVEIAGTGLSNVADPTMPNVRWLGDLEHAQLQNRMRSTAIYAAPAYYEPFGLGILEAAANGCALVLSDIVSLRELWDGAALFVPPGSSVRLRESLIRVCADEVLRARLQRAARARAQRYSGNQMLSRYLDLYRAIRTANPSHNKARQETRA
jgi:glycosyltransferase involved in cell wall biosynthesis